MVLKEKQVQSILLVDDDMDILDLLRESLEELSFKVYTAQNGLEALNFLATNRVECIITDITMPIMDGTELIEKLREREDHTPFFFITGYLDFPREHLNKLKPQAIIFKPFDFEETALLVKNYVMRIS